MHLLLLYAADAWSAKSNYTADEIRDINRLNGLLFEIKACGHVTDDQRAHLATIAGNCQLCQVCSIQSISLLV